GVEGVVKCLQDVIECGDSLFAVPTFDFFFKVAIPKSRKGREIIKRDYLGRIVAAKVPELPLYAQK
ncbi:hypothetical protein ACFL0Y_03520, partial [Patescibacteria group bacterium]